VHVSSNPAIDAANKNTAGSTAKTAAQNEPGAGEGCTQGQAATGNQQRSGRLISHTRPGEARIRQQKPLTAGQREKTRNAQSCGTPQGRWFSSTETGWGTGRPDAMGRNGGIFVGREGSLA